MKKYYYQLLISLIFFGLSFQIRAENLIGGKFDFTHTSGNSFNVKATVFVDKGVSATSPDLYQNFITVRIYSKGSNSSLDVLMETIQLNQTSKKDDFPYDNKECASSFNVSTTKIEYERDIILPKSNYNNPGGYYLVWQDGYRNATINANTSTVGMTLYLEFPRLDIQDNSSPTFRLNKGIVACVNAPLPNVDLGADDKDSDTRTYSFVTPYSFGGNSRADFKQINLPNPRNYTSILWNGSYSATNPIAGTNIRLDPNTGALTGTPTVPGKYLICVECKEFRNNVQIGLNRMDFEIIVDICTSPKPKIYLEGNNPTIHETLASICEYSYRVLETIDNASFTYVWKKGGVVVPGETKSKIKVLFKDADKYTVTVTRTGVSCPGTETSLETELRSIGGVEIKISVPDSTICSDFAPINLRVEKSDGTLLSGSFGKKWFKNEVLIPNEVVDIYSASASGKYKIVVTDFSTVDRCIYEATQGLVITTTPTPTITNLTGKTAVCQGDVVKLRVAPVEANVNYQWERDIANFATITDLEVNLSGAYRIKATSTINTDCEAYTPEIDIVVNPLPTVTFDDITPVCTSKSAKVDLRNLVNPYDATLGKFTGTGVNGYEFDPSVSGYGSFPIKYDYKTAVGCSGNASKIAIVDLSPVVKLGNDITIFRGDTIRLKSVGSTGNKYVYDWTPATSLSSPNIPQPIATPDVTTEYVVKVTSVLGKCTATDKIVITVKSVLKIPSAFTPNSDAINDTWTIMDNNREFNDYPDIEVKIFNRWGGEIFFSTGSGAYQTKPFDGIQDGQRLPAGTYFYVIKPSPDVPSLTGYVTIVR